jgi:hypothetical protein
LGCTNGTDPLKDQPMLQAFADANYLGMVVEMCVATSVVGPVEIKKHQGPMLHTYRFLNIFAKQYLATKNVFFTQNTAS